ncbi:MAG: hypothetical protein K1X67_11030 [Fimbriimonadaceae bacterium]|nr:hypothetical protein [Fimbriimonadaceae bacterium]
MRRYKVLYPAIIIWRICPCSFYAGESQRAAGELLGLQPFIGFWMGGLASVGYSLWFLFPDQTPEKAAHWTLFSLGVSNGLLMVYVLLPGGA